MFTYIVSNFEKVLFSLLFLGSHFFLKCHTCHTSPHAMPLHTTHSNKNTHTAHSSKPSHPRNPPPLHSPDLSSSLLTSPIIFLWWLRCPLPRNYRENCLIIPPHQVSPLFLSLLWWQWQFWWRQQQRQSWWRGQWWQRWQQRPPLPPPPKYLAHSVV